MISENSLSDIMFVAGETRPRLMLFEGSDVVFERVVVNKSKIGLFIKANQSNGGASRFVLFQPGH